MSLLKVFIAVVMTASISLLLSSKLQAVDHPWDDNKGDTTTIVGNTNPLIGNEPRPVVTTTITSRFLEWTRILFLEIKGVLLGGEKTDVSVKPPTGKTNRHFSPFDRKK